MVAHQIHDLKVGGSIPFSAIVAHLDKEGLAMHWKALAVVLIALCFAVLQGAAGFEQRALKAIAQPAMFAAAPDEDQAARNMEVIKDHFRLIVCGIGALLGSAISLIFVIMRSVINPKEEGVTLDTRVKRTLFFILSLFFSVMVTPMLARVGVNYWDNLRHPEVLLALAGFMAIAAWAIMQIYDYCTRRFTSAARDKGASGVLDEVNKIRKGE